MSSDEDGADLMASFKKGKGSGPSRTRKEPSVSPGMFFSEDESSATEGGASAVNQRRPTRKVAVAVRVPPMQHPRSEYTYHEPKETAERILREYARKG